MYWIMVVETDKDGSFHYFYGNLGSPFRTIEDAQKFIDNSLIHKSGDCLKRDFPYKIDGNIITIEDGLWGTTTIEHSVIKIEKCS